MICTLREHIRFLGSVLTLRPGDLITTGTPRAHWLLLLLAGVVALPAFAQPAKVYRIGMLESTPAIANRGNLNAFLKGLREAGYVEGKNIVIDYRSADGRPERFPELAAELVRAKSDIIVTRGSDAALAARDAGSVPVVMATSADPVAAGVVKSFTHPGGNVTGLTTFIGEVPVKRIQVLKKLAPRTSRIAAMLDLAHATANVERRHIEHAAKSLGLQAIILDVRDPEGLERAFEAARQQRADALLINSEAVMMANGKAIVDFARKHSLPAMYSAREYVEAGGLAAYGVSYQHLYYRAASYVDKILKGANPGDLPIGRPTKLSLIINFRAAAALGIAIPSELLIGAELI